MTMNDFPIPIIGVMSFFIPYELHWHSSIEEMLKSTYLPAVNIILTLDNVYTMNALGIQAKRQDAKLHSCFLCMSGHWTSLQINARMRSMALKPLIPVNLMPSKILSMKFNC